MARSPASRRAGDAGAGGSTFDFAENPWINNRGDVAFEGHVVGDEIITGGTPQSAPFRGRRGVHPRRQDRGDPPHCTHRRCRTGRGHLRHAWGPVVNDNGAVLFVGDLTAAPANDQFLGLFLNRGNKTIAVARRVMQCPAGGTSSPPATTPTITA